MSFCLRDWCFALCPFGTRLNGILQSSIRLQSSSYKGNLRVLLLRRDKSLFLQASYRQYSIASYIILLLYHFFKHFLQNPYNKQKPPQRELWLGINRIKQPLFQYNVKKPQYALALPRLFAFFLQKTHLF